MRNHVEVFVKIHPQGWAVARPNAERASGVFPTQAEAIELARKIAGTGPIHIQRRDGKFRPLRPTRTATARSAQQAQASERAAYRHQEMAWLRAHFADLARHRGRWVVLEGQGILASEQDYLEARRRATLAGVQRPLIFFVPDDGADAFIGV